jgi:hypothetical protein
MIELRVTIKKATNIQSARERLLSAAASEESVQETPPPAVQVVGATDAGVLISLTAWVETHSFRQTSGRLAERVASAVADL